MEFVTTELLLPTVASILAVLIVGGIAKLLKRFSRDFIYRLATKSIADLQEAADNDKVLDAMYELTGLANKIIRPSSAFDNGNDSDKHSYFVDENRARCIIENRSRHVVEVFISRVNVVAALFISAIIVKWLLLDYFGVGLQLPFMIYNAFYFILFGICFILLILIWRSFSQGMRTSRDKCVHQFMKNILFYGNISKNINEK